MKYNRKNYAELWGLLPFILCLVLIPLIVKTHTFANPLKEYAWYAAYDYSTDFFLYYKAIGTIICGITILVLVCAGYKKKRICTRDFMMFIPLALYEFLAVLSSLFSEHAWFAFHGMPDQFESLLVLLAYGLICIYAYGYVYECNEVRMKQILTIFLCGVLLIGLICAMQYFRMDIYRWIYSDDGYTFSFRLGQVYGPFYNINYVGSYVSLILPVLVMLLFSHTPAGYRVAGGVCAILLLIALVGGDSSTGMIAVAASVVCCMMFLLYRKLHNWKKNVVVTLVIAMVAVIALGKPVISRLTAAIQAADTEKKDLESIITNDDNVEFHYKGHTLYISMDITDGQLFLSTKDENADPVACTVEMEGDGGYYRIDDARFGGCIIEPIVISQEAEQYGVLVHMGESKWCISNQIDDTGTYYYVTSSKKATKLTGEEASGDIPFLRNVSFLFNGRGYLWNKSLVTSAKYILLGSGADTFAIAYPNDDYVDKSNNGYGGMIVTRPHNMYLQIAVQTGWLALICFLVLCGWYLINSLQIYYNKKFDSLESYLGFGVMLGVFGYLVTGIANDSTVTVAPVFWMLLGIGIALNHNLKKEMQ